MGRRTQRKSGNEEGQLKVQLGIVSLIGALRASFLRCLELLILLSVTFVVSCDTQKA